MQEPESIRKRVLRRKAELFDERSSWLEHWREISEFIQPRSGRFLTSDSNDGKKRHNKIIDNGGLLASRTLAAGMMSGNTSPARPWFRLALAERDLMEFQPVKAWLFHVQTAMRDVFAKSNTYRTLQMMYEECGLFGTAADVVLDDFDNVLHHYPLTIGEYALGTNEKGVADTLAREYQLTVHQLVQRFGKDAVSPTVRTLYERGNLSARVDVIHLIEPREGYDHRKADNRNMRWRSVYVEAGAPDDKVLRESGFKRFPALAPRWHVTGNDTYGQGPGMEALGDNKQLQHQQMRKGQGIDYQVNPPLQVPTQYKGNSRARLPGGVMYVDAVGQGGGIKSAFDVQLNLQHLTLDIQDVRERINQAFYKDLFLMLANDTRSGVTATEVAQRHEEKLLMLGPTLERLENELLKPLIDRTFDRAMEAGILPDPPPELQGQDLQVEFIGVLSQAQRMVSAQGLDRLLGSVTSMAAMWPEARLKIKPMQVVDAYADMFGVNPEVVATDDEAAEAMAAEQQKAAAAQAAATAPAAVDAAKTASEIDPAQLREVIGQFSGYSSPQPQDGVI